MRVQRFASVQRLAVVAVIALVAGLGIVQVASAPPADAASGSEFSPGNIISDAKFHDASTMTVAQIQGFLNSKVANCVPGYTCLKNYSQTTWTRAADQQCATYTAGNLETAATIIARVASVCGINPQVLLVLLEKEQGLVTASAPSATKYAKATGFACPDTAPCDTQFAGFYNQVFKAAWQFRYYENHPTSYRYAKNAVVNIQLHPNAACGTKPVYIETQATANLYIYTPYQPNSAALANMYGSGDACSAYGNRNFWRLFTDWFGSTTGPKSTFGSLDLAKGVGGGIQVRGWALDPYIKGSAYVWMEIDGSGFPVLADNPLNWVNGLYPGAGPNHGYDEILSASPGEHQVCVSQTNGISLGCADVVVPTSTTGAGYVDSVTAVAGNIVVKGWSLDRTTSAQTYVWVDVDGASSPYKVDIDLPWTAAAYPGTGIRHGFNISVPATRGVHEVCVAGSEFLFSCNSVTVVGNETGAVESAVGVRGGVEVKGWTLDQRTSASSYVWATIDGVGGPAKADKVSAAATAAFPALGGNHGYSVFLAGSPGPHKVCMTGTTENYSYGCRTVTVPPNEVGFFDTAVGVLGGAAISGWSLDQSKNLSTYVWVTVDGANGRPVPARDPLNWVAGLYPGIGSNHGFTTTIPTSPGKHRICVAGTQENVSYGCKDVTVPHSEVGFFDTAVGVTGGVLIEGWSLDQTKNLSTWVWVTVDGANGRPVPARDALNWVAGLYPGIGSNHGFETMIPTSPGKHRICVAGTQENVSYGCKDIIVPEYLASVDTVEGVPGGIHVTGWAADRTSTATLYFWVTIDGSPTIVAANQPLGWIDNHLPGVGPNHGVNALLPAKSGRHEVCITLTSGNKPLGCSTVVVP